MCFNQRMNKQRAIQLLGGTNRLAAEAIGITSQAVSLWPEELPRTISDRVEAAYHRLNGVALPVVEEVGHA